MSQAEDLARPFPRDLLKDQEKGGRRFTYIPAAEVIVRLNAVLGVGQWSTEADAFRDGDWVIGRVKLMAQIDGRHCEAVQYGGQEVKKYSSGKKQGEPVDLGDDFKGAVSDAMKKAAQQLGVGLYIARTPEAKKLVPQRTAPDTYACEKCGVISLIEASHRCGVVE